MDTRVLLLLLLVCSACCKLPKGKIIMPNGDPPNDRWVVRAHESVAATHINLQPFQLTVDFTITDLGLYFWNQTIPGRIEPCKAGLGVYDNTGKLLQSSFKQMAYGHVAVGEPTWATFKLDKPVSTKANDKFWVGLIALDPGCGEMKLEAPAPGLGYNFNITYIDTTFPKKLNLHYFPHFTSFGPRAVAVINSDK
eukprot:TRINITY_DN46196_c0_g1_i2.p1 TRINITY_DN46196_c0_g1~~TRINITY_DN46196_c0_g1_i2.p1  ORF type:complete len:195 (-),score=17.62 TRINITY_DN46196_c0_g1_i2:74-658(-)